MNENFKLLLKNGFYTFSSNATSFIINALIVLIIPKLIGVSEYGYFQLYILLATYALYFHFGWCDGIYLRYVGKNYNELDKKMMSAQFRGIVKLSMTLLIFLLILVRIFFHDFDKIWVYSIASIVVFVVTPKTYTTVVMQMTNRMKNYSQIVLAEKVIYALILAIMLLFGIRDYKVLILSDVMGKISALITGMYFCRDIIFEKPIIEKKDYVTETKNNISVGLFLLISNLASLLVTGIIQFSIEFNWGIETFGKVSLTFNMSKMLLVVITAMSSVLIPVLKHMNPKELSYLYKGLRSGLMLVLGLMLAFYYPIKVILSAWLPQYIVSLKYMALLFPMCLFESKTQLLINSYMKALRKEKWLCFANALTVGISAVVSVITVFQMENLNLAILTIPYLLAFRCFILEMYIGFRLHLKLVKNGLLEIGLASSFIFTSWFIEAWYTCVIYILFYLVYVFLTKEDIIILKKNLRWILMPKNISGSRE